jgi:hypothetical protein
VLANRQMEPRSYTAAFNGSQLSSGLYFYRLDTRQFFGSEEIDDHEMM